MLGNAICTSAERNTQDTVSPLKTQMFAGQCGASTPINGSEIAAQLRSTLPFNLADASQSQLLATTDILQDGHILATVIGAPRWKSDDLKQQSLVKGHASALLTAYRAHGNKLHSELNGHYAFAIIDDESGRVLLSTDRIASIPVFYHIEDKTVVFGTSAHAVLTASDSSNTAMTHQGIYDYTYFHMVPSPVSVYSGIRKLMMAELVVIEQGSVSCTHHWLPQFKNTNSNSFDACTQKLRDELRESVRDAARSDKNVACFLSGGLDSSTVAGMLSEVSDGKAHAYSIGFSAEGYDEMAYARITAQHFGVELHEYYVTPEDVVEALPKVATSYDEPFGNSSALPAYFCAKVAKENGVELLLAGDGGDELFAGNERYAKQKVFEAYQRVPELLRSTILEPVINRIPGAVPYSDKARSYVAQANVPLPDRLQTYNFLNRHQPEEIFTDAFIAQVSTSYPSELQREIYQRPQDASSLSRMLYLDWQITLADNDLRKVSQMCSLAGVEVAYPMLDDRLFELACELPDDWKLKGQTLRHFYKESLRGWLPDATINKSKQGFGLPFGVWMQTHAPLREMAYDSLLKIKTRGYFRPEFIEHLVQLHRDGHAAYYGELIWILTVLELWLAHNDTPEI